MLSATGTSWELQHAWPLPVWSLGLLLVVTAGLIVWLLVREGIGRQRTVTLAMLRVTVVVLIFLMLGRWQLSRYETDLPDLVIAVDDSMSMQFPAGDSATDQGVDRLQRAQRLIAGNRWVEQLDLRYRVKKFAVSDQVRSVGSFDDLEADGTASRLGQGLLEISDLQRGRSTAAIVLLSDGTVTEGVSLSEAAERLAARNIPLWTVGLGTDAHPPEIAIAEVIADDQAFLGDEVHVSVLLRGTLPANGEVSVELRDRDSSAMLTSEPVRIEASSTRALVPLTFSVDRPGLWNLEVVVPAVEGEVFVDNNRKSLNVMVRDDPINVLLIGQKPSYEFRFLKHLLERARGQGRTAASLINLISVLQEGDPRYAEQDRFAAKLPPVKRDELEALDVVILCDADTGQLGELMIGQIDELVRQRGLGLIVVAGPENRLSIAADSQFAALLPVDPGQVQVPDGLQDRPRQLVLTQLGRTVGKLPLPGNMTWSETPPIYWLLRAEAFKETAQVMLATQSQQQESSAPAVVTHLVGVGQVWLQLTDESFRWISASSEHNIHERYWLQVIRQLARRKRIESTDRAELHVSGERFIAGQAVEIELRLPEPQPRRQGRVAIGSGLDEPRLEVLYPTGDPHVLRTSITDLAAGDYLIRLVDPAFEDHPDPIGIRVESPSIEFLDGRASPAELDRASRISGGELLSPEQAAASLLDRLPPGRTIRLNELPAGPIWNHWLAAALVISLLCGEWILRRRWQLS